MHYITKVRITITVEEKVKKEKQMIDTIQEKMAKNMVNISCHYMGEKENGKEWRDTVTPEQYYNCLYSISNASNLNDFKCTE